MEALQHGHFQLQRIQIVVAVCRRIVEHISVEQGDGGKPPGQEGQKHEDEGHQDRSRPDPPHRLSNSADLSPLLPRLRPSGQVQFVVFGHVVGEQAVFCKLFLHQLRLLRRGRAGTIAFIKRFKFHSRPPPEWFSASAAPCKAPSWQLPPSSL